MTQHKHDENCNHNHDGIDNEEHFLDMFSEIEMLFQNIKDNTDGAFDILKAYENTEDNDLIDVIKIDASEILEVEKLTSPVFEEIQKIKNLIQNKNNYLENKEIIEKYFNFLKINEKKSSYIFDKLLKKLN